MAKSLARVNIDLTATNAKLTQKLKDSESKLQRYQKKSNSNFKKMGGGLTTLAKGFTTLSVGAVSALAAITRAGLASADALGKTADKLGILPEKLQALQRAGELTGVSVNTTNMALQRMVRRVAEAAQGTGEAAGALGTLGLSAKELAALPVDQQFSRIADAMGKTANQGERVRLAMKLFDSEGVALVNTLKLGSEGLQQIYDDMEAAGQILSAIDVKKIEQANDSITMAKGNFTSFSQQLAAKFSPAIVGVNEKFGEWVKSVGGFDDIAVEAFNNVIKAVGFFADALNGLKVVWLGIRVVVTEYFNTIIQSIAKADLLISKLLAKFGKGDGNGSTFIQGMAEGIDAGAEELRGKLADALLAPVPSEAIKEFIADVDQKMTAAATEQAEAREGDSPVGTLSGLGGEAEEQPWYKGLVDKLEITKRFEEAELAMKIRHEKELKATEGAEAKARLRAKQAIEKKKLKDTKSTLGQGIAILAKSNKTAFNAIKAYNIAEALIEAKKSVVSAYKFGSSIGGPPVGAAFAGVAAVAQAANVKAIASQSFNGGGGGSVSSAGSSAPSIPTTPAANDSVDTSFTAPEKQDITIRSNDPFTPTVIREFIEKLDEEGVDMGYNISFVTG
tara:strand:- start:3130 stop:4989 length:1860 start_codon:yes stop_codon:yes gene_type:complete